MTSGPTDYPNNWPGARNQAPTPATPVEAVMLAIDSFVSALSPEEFDQLVQRTGARCDHEDVHEVQRDEESHRVLPRYDINALHERELVTL